MLTFYMGKVLFNIINLFNKKSLNWTAINHKVTWHLCLIFKGEKFKDISIKSREWGVSNKDWMLQNIPINSDVMHRVIFGTLPNLWKYVLIWKLYCAYIQTVYININKYLKCVWYIHVDTHIKSKLVSWLCFQKFKKLRVIKIQNTENKSYKCCLFSKQKS